MKYGLGILALLLLTACATRYLWSETDPYVLVAQKDITEDELKARHLKYARDDRFQVFYVEKRGLEKYKDYAIRIMGTPVTVVIDAAATATTIVVVGGAFYLSAVASSGNANPFDFIAGVLDMLNAAATSSKPQAAETNATRQLYP